MHLNSSFHMYCCSNSYNSRGPVLLLIKCIFSSKVKIMRLPCWKILLRHDALIVEQFDIFMSSCFKIYHLGYNQFPVIMRIWPIWKHNRDPDPSVFVVLALIFTMFLTLKRFSLDLATSSAFRPINCSWIDWLRNHFIIYTIPKIPQQRF